MYFIIEMLELAVCLCAVNQNQNGVTMTSLYDTCRYNLYRLDSKGLCYSYSRLIAACMQRQLFIHAKCLCM